MNQKSRLILQCRHTASRRTFICIFKREAKASKPVIQYWIANEKVKVNHKSVNHNVRLESGDSVMIDLREEEESGIVPEYGNFRPV